MAFFKTLFFRHSVSLEKFIEWRSLLTYFTFSLYITLNISHRYVLFLSFKKFRKIYADFFFCLFTSFSYNRFDCTCMGIYFYFYFFLFIRSLYEHSDWNCIARRWECNDLHILNDQALGERRIVEIHFHSRLLKCSRELYRNKEDIRLFYLKER